MALLYLLPIFIFHSWTAIFLWLVIVTFGLPLAAIDLLHHRLPDVLTGALLLASTLVVVISALVHHRFDRLLPSAIGAVSLLSFYLAIMIISKGGMGMGDVKLSPSIGLISGFFGLRAVLVSSFAAYILGSVIGVALMIAGRAGRKTAIPFGPFMIVGQIISLLVLSRSGS